MCTPTLRYPNDKLASNPLATSPTDDPRGTTPRRLERLVALLETGSTTAVRETAAKQLGDLARREFERDHEGLKVVDQTVKEEAGESATGQGSEVVVVEATTGEGTTTTPNPAGPYAPTLRLIGRILPHISSRSMETRLAGVKALDEVLSAVDVWTVAGDDQVEQPATERVKREDGWLDVESVVRELKSRRPVGAPLAASTSGLKRNRSIPGLLGQQTNAKASSSSLSARGPPPGKRIKVEASAAPSSTLAFLDGLSIPRDLVDEDSDLDMMDRDDGGVAMAEAAGDVIEAEGHISKPMSAKRFKVDSPRPLASREVTPGAKKSTGFKLPKVKKENAGTTPMSLPDASSSTSIADPTDEMIFTGLSSRQALLLKRKIRGGLSKSAAMAESMRLQGGGTPVDEGGPSPGPSGDTEDMGDKDKATVKQKRKDVPDVKPSMLGKKSNKDKTVVKEEPGVPRVKSEDQTATPVIDSNPHIVPATPVSAGGPVEASRFAIDLDEIVPRSATGWVWSRLTEKLAGMLESESWETRHGAALAIRDLIRVQGRGCGLSREADPTTNRLRHQDALQDLAKRLVLVLVRDRFGDFIGDSVMAPVRESAAQALASVTRWMDPVGVGEVGKTLLQMIIQGWADLPYVWELRHAGLLGLRYMLAVLKGEGVLDPRQDAPSGGLGLYDVLAASMIGLADSDDDVRSVSATCLLPILPLLADTLLDDEMAALLTTLWNCFSSDGDDLGSSTSAVMDLLCRILAFPKVVKIYSKATGRRQTLSLLVPRLYPYFRHTIGAVRVAAVRTLQAFFDDADLPTDWINSDILHLLYKNLIVEDRTDCRFESLRAWRSALSAISSRPDFLSNDVLPNVAGWLNIALTPINIPLESHIFQQVVPLTIDTGHNVDKSILAADLALVSPETILRNRIDAIKALAEITRYDVAAATHQTLLGGYLTSTSAHQLSLCGILVEEWTRVRDETLQDEGEQRLQDALPSVEPLIDLLDRLVDVGPPGDLYESKASLQAIRQEAKTLVSLVDRHSKETVDPATLEDRWAVATVEDIEALLDSGLDASLNKLTPAKRKLASAAVKDRLTTLATALDRHRRQQVQLGIQVQATAAAALIGMRFVPAKMNPLMKGIMSGVKLEENELLQTRAASSVAKLIKNCLDPAFGLPVRPALKLIENLPKFVCSDEIFTPQFESLSSAQGILTLAQAETAKVNADDVVRNLEQEAQALTRRGALAALSAIVDKLGDTVFEQAPNFWHAIAAPIEAQVGEADETEEDYQALIDALTTLQVVLPLLPASLHSTIDALVPGIVAAIQSSYAVIRNAAGKALAVVCRHMAQQGMKAVLDDLLPLLGDTRNLHRRQGAMEAVWAVVDTMQFDILPYVLFMVVPVLGRMSDSDESMRLLATQTFATLVKLVPLEAGIPEPPGISQEMLAKRESERDFLSQLLDNRKVQSYVVPVPIKAELRSYQQDGINWMAFLAKYQLHGCLCDDMGLGKSLQSICIVASKHEERRARFAATRSPDSAHLPTLIVCPTTLIGHWYHEITKFTNDLRPFKYYGSTTERVLLRRQIQHHDVIVTSYETIRSDIDFLQRTNFLYCILDEGHMIKNSKSKLTLAVKSLQSVHRLILSGTPIQNNVLELWSLFDFLMPGFLGTEKEFTERFSRPILANKDAKATPKQKEGAILALEALHKQVLPFVLRRMKEDVLQDLPPKIIQDYYCDLSRVQQSLYDDFQASKASDEAVKSLVDESNKEDADMEAPAATPQKHIFQTLQYLRKLCNHPMLALGADTQRYQEVVRRVSASDKDVSKDPWDISHSPKLLALQQLLRDCGIGDVKSDPGEVELLGSTSQHRVLIFCQTRQMLDIIQDQLFVPHMPSVSFMRLDGGTEPMKRHDIVQTFNGDPSIDVLLLTTSVGGLGLTLTGADTVIFVDHDWNPSKDMQAMDRAHRLGQKKVVNVYRLITRDTLEEKIMSLQRFKQNMANTVISQQNQGLETMNTDQVLDLFAGPSRSGPAKPVKDGPMSKNDILAGLGDLPAEEEYEDLTLDAFMSKF